MSPRARAVVKRYGKTLAVVLGAMVPVLAAQPGLVPLWFVGYVGLAAALLAAVWKALGWDDYRDVPPSRYADMVKAATGSDAARPDGLIPPRLAIDGAGCAWRVYPDMWSMCRVNPDNSPIPEPITFYVPEK